MTIFICHEIYICFECLCGTHYKLLSINTLLEKQKSLRFIFPHLPQGKGGVTGPVGIIGPGGSPVSNVSIDNI